MSKHVHNNKPPANSLTKESPQHNQATVNKRQKFTQQQKKDAVRLIDESQYSFAAAAKAVGCAEPTLRAWHMKYGLRKQSGETANAYEDLKNELKRTKEQLKRAEMERDILKKATAYFASLKP
jgi:transposase